jgi:hypothetical protein
VSRISDDALIEIANLDFDTTVGIGHRAEIPNVTVTANPEGRAIWQAATIHFLQPFVEFDGATANVRVGRARHLQISTFAEKSLSIFGEGKEKRALTLFQSNSTASAPALSTQSTFAADSCSLSVEDG